MVSSLYTYQGDVFYSGSPDGEDYELWKYDGVQNSLIKNIEMSGSSFPGDFFTKGDLIYFTATNCDIGKELWRTDGTESGTRIVFDLNPGVASSDPSRFVQFGDDLLFNADDGTHGSELFILRSCTDSVNEICESGPCDLFTSYKASGEITLEGNFRILDGSNIELNSGSATNLLEEIEIQNGGILNVLTEGCDN